MENTKRMSGRQFAEFIDSLIVFEMDITNKRIWFEEDGVNDGVIWDINLFDISDFTYLTITTQEECEPSIVKHDNYFFDILSRIIEERFGDSIIVSTN